MGEIINFLDIETTGSNFGKDQIIEIAAIKVKEDKIVDTFETLIKPTTQISYFATKIHGITNSMLVDSPSFKEISKDLTSFLEDGVFAAHNARFDYSYVKKSLNEEDIEFKLPRLCTVKLSRRLYPQHIRHGLSHIISRYNIPIDARHRAMGDTKATLDFYLMAKNEHDKDIFIDAKNRAISF